MRQLKAPGQDNVGPSAAAAQGPDTTNDQTGPGADALGIGATYPLGQDDTGENHSDRADEDSRDQGRHAEPRRGNDELTAVRRLRGLRSGRG